MCELCILAQQMLSDTDLKKAQDLADKIETLLGDVTNGEVVVAMGEYLANAAMGSPAPLEAMAVYKRVCDILLMTGLQTSNVDEAVKQKAKATLH